MARVLSILVAVSLLAAGAAAAAEGAGSAKPTLALVRTSPSIAVRGAHFAPAKRIRLVLTFDGTRTSKVVRSSSSGAFFAALAAPQRFDPCSDSFVVLAIPSTGERASVKFLPRECPPAP
jgi:hypothetical protein